MWCADLLKKTLNAFKNPQLKRKTPAVSLFLEVNGQTYLGDEVAAAGGDSGPVVSGRSGEQGPGNDAMGSQVESPSPNVGDLQRGAIVPQTLKERFSRIWQE